MLYLVGLGLNEKGLSLEAKEILENLDGKSGSSKIYLEGYTIDFPYSIEKLEKEFGFRIEKLERGDVESSKLINEAKKRDVVLFVYGSPLFATTHVSLINEAKKNKVKTKVLYSSSVFDAIAETGLELYKFGKITSMPRWIEGKYMPDSFIDVIKKNESIKAHSLVLCDIGLGFRDALIQLEKASKNKALKIENIVLCSKLGYDSKIIYGSIERMKKLKDIANPFCFIIPSELHFVEKDMLDGFSF